MTTLSKHKSILCTQCGKSFTRQSHLEEHINIHEGKKPYECEICARPFASKSNLAKHERIHTGEKQFTCTKCKKRFTLKRNMIEHEKIHSGKRDHECKICNQTFTRNCSLTRHLKAQRHVRVLVRYLRIHTGKKHFECYECPKEFPFKNYLRQHIIVEHLKKKFWKPRHCYDPKKEHIDVSSSIPQEIVFVDCEKPSEDDIEEKFSTMAIDPIDENKSDIEEEYTEKLERQEEIREKEKDGVPTGSETSLFKRRLTVVLTPFILRVSSLQEVSVTPPQENQTVSQLNEDNNIMTKNEYKNIGGRQLSVRLYRMEESNFPIEIGKKFGN